MSHHTNHSTDHDAEAAQAAFEFIWGLRCARADNTAEYREQVKDLARLFNYVAMITQNAGASTYEYAAELITEAADSHTHTGEDEADAEALDRAIFTAAKVLEDTAHHAREREEDEAMTAAGYGRATYDALNEAEERDFYDALNAEEQAEYNARWTLHPITDADNS